MKHVPPPASLLPCLAAAICVLSPLHRASADDQYDAETQRPRIGTRILHFFKDLAYGDNPNDRYRKPPSNSRRTSPQQHPYGAASQGGRYNLDQPPPVNSMPARRPRPDAPESQQFAERSMAPRDMPYAADDTPPSATKERRKHQAGIAAQEDELPPVKPKSKSTAVAKAPAPSKASIEEAPAPQKKTIPLESTVKETQTVSSNASSSKKSWQAFSGHIPTTQTSNQAPAESKTTAAPPSQSGATLTGSKTTKEGRVKSPYAPFNELDVTGLPAGSLAMDPTTGKVFRVP